MASTWTQSVTGLNQHLTTITFIGIELEDGQEIIGNSVTSATFDLKKEGSPTGTMTVQVYNNAGSLIGESDSYNVASLGTSYSSIDFTNISSTATDIGTCIVLAISGSFDSSNRPFLSMGATSPSDTLSRYTTSATWDNASGITGEYSTMSVTYSDPPSADQVFIPPPPAQVRL
tara:strand:- start:533 stop:1054 length:522 start_codon:yes stop_codon:yes gene_type:complete